MKSNCRPRDVIVEQVEGAEVDLLAQRQRDARQPLLLAEALLEVAAQQRQRHVGDLGHRIDAGPGLRQRLGRDVGGEQADRVVAGLVQPHQDRVGLLAGRARRRPAVEDAARAARPQLRRVLGEEVEVPRLAEEVGVVGGDRVEQRRHRLAGSVGLHVGEVGGEAGEAAAAHPLLQPRRHQLALAAVQRDAAALVDQLDDRRQVALGRFERRVDSGRGQGPGHRPITRRGAPRPCPSGRPGRPRRGSARRGRRPGWRRRRRRGRPRTCCRAT